MQTCVRERWWNVECNFMNYPHTLFHPHLSTPLLLPINTTTNNTKGCAREDYAGVNARISAVADWIEQQICELSNFPPNTCPSKTPPISYAQEPVSGSNGGSTGTFCRSDIVS